MQRGLLTFGPGLLLPAENNDSLAVDFDLFLMSPIFAHSLRRVNNGSLMSFKSSSLSNCRSSKVKQCICSKQSVAKAQLWRPQGLGLGVSHSLTKSCHQLITEQSWCDAGARCAAHFFQLFFYSDLFNLKPRSSGAERHRCSNPCDGNPNWLASA